jgi:hypothetical protein
MANCIRSGNHYKRHKFEDRKCVHCGADQLAASHERLLRRNDHRARLGHPAATGNPSGNAHDRAVAQREQVSE